MSLHHWCACCICPGICVQLILYIFGCRSCILTCTHCFGICSAVPLCTVKASINMSFTLLCVFQVSVFEDIGDCFLWVCWCKWTFLTSSSFFLQWFSSQCPFQALHVADFGVIVVGCMCDSFYLSFQVKAICSTLFKMHLHSDSLCSSRLLDVLICGRCLVWWHYPLC
jgi:hypothetical protein